jgi:hypothetical protein
MAAGVCGPSFEARREERRAPQDDGGAFRKTVIARSQRVRPLAGPMINSATKQSSLLLLLLDCFAEPVIGRRFAPARWLAMTLKIHTFSGYRRASASLTLRSSFSLK